MLDGKPPWENEAYRSVSPTTQDTPFTIVCSVYGRRLTVDVDGKQVIVWEGDPQRLSVGPEWAPRDAGCFYVGADCAARFSTLELAALDSDRPLEAQTDVNPPDAADLGPAIAPFDAQEARARQDAWATHVRILGPRMCAYRWNRRIRSVLSSCCFRQENS
jgi:hypothetical protein